MKSKKTLVVFIILVSRSLGYSQTTLGKPIIDSIAIEKWTAVTRPGINDAGTYAGYVVDNVSINQGILHLKSLTGEWEKIINGVTDYALSADNKRAIYLDNAGNLVFLKLGQEEITKKKEVTSFKLFTSNGKEWLLYKLATNELVLIDMSLNRQSRFDSTSNYVQSEDKSRLVLINNEKDSSFVSFVDLKNLKRIPAFKSKMQSFVVDRNARQIAFLNNDKISYCILGKSKPFVIATSQSKNIDSNLGIADLNGFNYDGNRLLLHLKKLKNKEEKNPSEVRIWNYKDIYLKSLNLSEDGSRTYLSSLNLQTKKIHQIEQDGENAFLLNSERNNYYTIDYQRGDLNESNWNKLARHKFYIYDDELQKKCPLIGEPRSISPNGRYLLLHDSLNVEFNIYELATGSITALTDIASDYENQESVVEYDLKRWTFAGWLEDKALFYDEYDLWSFELGSINRPVNLTNGYGKRNKIIFRIAKPSLSKIYSNNDLDLLFAFNDKSKQNGFFKRSIDALKDPELLIMDDHYYGYPENINLSTFHPIKANAANVWIVARERSDSEKNYFTTTDFKNFKPLSDEFSEKVYNWFTTELLTYKTENGQEINGVLYKPENFDPKKKYPVIINYYQTFSEKLNIYIPPDLVRGNINVPWFVSHGYLVCASDIKFTKSKPGESALQAILSAEKCLSGLPFVDSLHIGLYGHSFGGYETNYIITHTNRFAAAVSSSGFSNLISAIGSVTFENGSNFFANWAEVGQGRIGYNLWERPDLYLENSPILKADKVETPLLMMANNKDGVVNISQGIEFFLALRRLGKRAWMLSYPNEYHVLIERKHRKDYTEKIETFFDYYLKEKQKPIWMISSE